MTNIPRPALPALAALGATLVLTIALVIAALSAPSAANAEPPRDALGNVIIIEATPTPALPLLGIPAYAAPGGAQLGDIPSDTPIRYRDSRAPGWVGMDWQGGVVWTLADGDASALRDLASPPQEQAPVAQQQPAPAQSIVYQQAPTAPPPAPPTWDQLPAEERAAVVTRNWKEYERMMAAGQAGPAPDTSAPTASGLPQPGDAGFVESFRDAGTEAFKASFKPAEQCAPQFISYLPGHPCYRK